MIERARYGGDYRDGRCFLNPDQGPETFAADCLKPAGADGRPRLLIWGDSHAAHLYPGVSRRSWIGKYALQQITASACSPMRSSNPNANTAVRPKCDQVQDFAISTILADKPAKVLLAWATGYNGVIPTDRASMERQLSPLVATLKELTAAGVGRIYVVGPIPQWDLPLPQEFYRARYVTGERRPQWLAPLEAQRLKVYDRQLGAIVENAGGKYISLIARLCDGDRCRTYVRTATGPSLLQFDGEHLTPAGSDWVARHIIGPAIGEPDTERGRGSSRRAVRLQRRSAGSALPGVGMDESRRVGGLDDGPRREAGPARLAAWRWRGADRDHNHILGAARAWSAFRDVSRFDCGRSGSDVAGGRRRADPFYDPGPRPRSPHEGE